LSKARHRVAKPFLQGKKQLVGVRRMHFVPATCDMNRLLTSLILLVSVLGFTIKAGAADRWETLRAINWVENPNNHTKMGRFGELGPYQFRAGTWKMHTRKSFQLANQRDTADEIAIKHYEWIKQSLEKAGVEASPFNIAMAWNSGVSNVVNGRAPRTSFDYAQRVTNLVHSFKRNNARAMARAANKAPSNAVPAVPAAPAVVPIIGMVHFNVLPDAPRFSIELPPATPAPVVYTARSPAPASNPTRLVFTTTATLTPNLSFLTN
jgi:hypothetical protein